MPTSVYCPIPVVESPAVFDIERRGRSAGSTNLPFIVYTNSGSGLQTTAYFRATGDVSGQNVAFAPYATRARVNFTIPEPRRFIPAVSLLLQIPAITNTTHEFHYIPESRFVRLEILSTNAIEGTSTNARLRLSRLVADAAVSVTFTLGGSARGPGDPDTQDYNFTSPFTMTIPAQSLSVETSIPALADGYLEGWESLFVTADFTPTDVSLDFQPPAVLFIREDTADTSSLPGSDVDLDGLPDYWEVANALNAQSPITQGEAELDADGDGLTNLEEYQFGTSPRAADTDANGVNDFLQNVLGADPGPDFVPVRLFVHDTGKVNNGMNCAVCHTTQIKVGDNSLYSMRSAFQEPAEKTYWYRKGQSYPIFLREIVATLPPTTNTIGNPTTTAKYTAALLPGTNTPQAFVVQDPANKLGTNHPWSNFPSNSLTQVATLVVPRIEVTWTNYPSNFPLDANTNRGGGLRMFPDRLSPTDEITREFVLIRVKTIPPVPDQPVRFKAFDVDDPTAHTDDLDGVIDSNDSGSVAVGEDNLGIPQFGQLLAEQLTLDNAGEATMPFRVALKPGDNYRIAVLLDTPGASNHVSQLQVNNPSGPFYVASGTNAVSGFIGGVSPMLTDWRKLHLEFDTMAAPPTMGPEAGYANGTIIAHRTNFPTAGRSHIAVRHSGGIDMPGLFASGKLEITGIGVYAVTNSWTLLDRSGMSRTVVEITGVPPGNLSNLAVKLYDDDDRYLVNDPLYPSHLGLQSPPLPALSHVTPFIEAAQSNFSRAYVLLVDANARGWNTQTTVPFKRREPAFSVFGTVFDSGNLQLKGQDRPEFWAFSVVFGYESRYPSEGDPNTLPGGDPDKFVPVSGATPETSPWLIVDPSRALGYCAIYLEGLRDDLFGLRGRNGDPLPAHFTHPVFVPFLQERYTNTIYGVIAHELAHAPGRQAESTDHKEGFLMGGPVPIWFGFGPKTIRRFRTTESWTRGPYF